MQTLTTMTRHILFLLSVLVSSVIIFPLLRELVELSLHDELYSHIPLVPVLSACLLYAKRRSIFSDVGYSFIAGPVVIAAGCVLSVIGWTREASFTRNDYLSLLIFSVLLVWAGCFVLFYGTRAFKGAVFPFAFLLFMVPLPDFASEGIIRFLQRGSTEAAHILFAVFGLPVAREGQIFHLSGFSIEVAEQCSGIRSSMALAITSALAGYLFLRRASTRILLAALVVPLAILKNGVRIVTLSLLGVYWDARIFQSDLHRKGGIVFFVLTLFLLWGIIVLLRKADKHYRVSGKARPRA